MTTSWPAPERPEPSETADERTLLDGFLDWHRATLQIKCAGLSPEQLCERPLAPSTLSLLGLVRHLTEVERGWFLQSWNADTPMLYCTDDNFDGDFDDTEPEQADADRARYLQAVDECRAASAARGLDDVADKERRDGSVKQYTLRWIYLHMIEEYARHNGHADLLREKLDGVTGE